MPTWSGILEKLSQSSPAGKPPQFDAVRRKYLVQTHQYAGRNVILYATKWTQHDANVSPDAISIVDEDLQGIMEVIHGLTGPNLDLILRFSRHNPHVQWYAGRQDHRKPPGKGIHQAGAAVDRPDSHASGDIHDAANKCRREIGIAEVRKDHRQGYRQETTKRREVRREIATDDFTCPCITEATLPIREFSTETRRSSARCDFDSHG